MTLPSSPFVLNVAFAGHRASVTGPDAEPMGAALRQAFDLIAQAARLTADSAITPGVDETIAQAHAGIGGAASGPPALRLLCGYAPGTDRVAVSAWREGRYGLCHLVFPYLAPPGGEDAAGTAFTDHPERPEEGAQVVLADAVSGPEDAVTILDGAASERERPPRAGHLEQSRFLMRWADVLVALWNGAPAKGAGGTADAVRLAVAKGLPVIWIDPRNWTLRLIDPKALWADTSPSELLDLLTDADDLETFLPRADADALAGVLRPFFAPPSDGAGHGADEGRQVDHGHKPHRKEAPASAEGLARKDYAADPMTPRSRRDRALMWVAQKIAAAWRPLINAVSGLHSIAVEADAPPSPQRSSATAAEPGLAVLEAEANRASRLADYTGNLQRVVQILLLVLAVLAVAVATSAAILPHLKIQLVLAELLILATVFVVWKVRVIAINHRRWSDSRRLAERLRAVLATWPLGVDVADDRSEPPGTWTEWRSRCLLRFAGPPTGSFGQDRVLQDARFARDHASGIVRGQIAYHTLSERRNGHVAHRLEALEEKTFVVLVASLVLFLVFHFVVESHQFHALNHHHVEMVGPFLLFLSAVLPMVAAACLAIEAKVGFHEAALRSAQLKPAFEDIRKAMADEILSPAQAQESLREAARLLTADADGWRDGVSRRRLAKL